MIWDGIAKKINPSGEKSITRSAPSFYSGISLQNKLRFSFILLILLPSVTIGIVFYNVAANNILATSGNNILDVVAKNVQIIDRQLSYVDKASSNLNTDETLFTILSEYGTYSDYELLLADREVQQLLGKYFPIDHLVSSNIITKRFIFGDNLQTVIPPKNFFSSGIYKELNSTTGTLWVPTYTLTDAYQLDFPSWNYPNVFSRVQALNPTYVERDAVQQRPAGAPEAILVMNFSDDIFRDMFEGSITVEGSFFVISSPQGDIVSHSNSERIGTQEALPWLTQTKQAPSASLVLEYNGANMLVCYAISPVTGWVSAVVVPTNNLLSSVSQLRAVSLLLGLLLLFLAMLLSSVFSHRITFPVKRLSEAMKKMGRGDFNQQVQAVEGDELQFLTHRFNAMSREIQTLIQENYESELRKKEAQIMALDLQLNPHFLHNTLNIINMMALENHQLEISKIIVSLSKMLQYTFQNPQELVTFEEEYLWIQNYTYIMQARFSDKFRVEYHIDPQLYGQKIPKLLLQPLVENAIIHGFAQTQRGGLLEVFGALSQDSEQIVITIRDNGKGMTPAEQEALMEGHRGQIGLRNTLKRMALIYEASQEVLIHSKVGVGTEIIIKYPKSTE